MLPKNLNYLWNLGFIAFLALVIQIFTGIFLAANYTPHVDHAFDSVERIMRDVKGGWLLRYAHAVGASFFFVIIYSHIGRGLYYGSYKRPRELIWMLGVVMLLIMIITAFMGYVLPWGQMSFWAATVITSLFSAIPIVGDHIVTWLWGGFSVGNPTLNRFFVLHYLFPFLLCGAVILHIWALHHSGSNNPSGVEVKNENDVIPFHPYYTVKDLVGLCFYMIVFCAFLFYIPDYLGHPDNYIPADPMVTPTHIVPEWYFLPYYAILRAIPNKLLGFVALLASIILLLFLPFIDRTPVKSARYRPLFRAALLLFMANFLMLMYCGSKPPEGIYLLVGRICSFYHFAYFLILLPFISKFERPKNPPESISADVAHMV